MADDGADTQRSDREQLESFAQQKRGGLIREYWAYLRHSKKFYLIPIVAMLMVLGALIVAGGSAVAPFLYTLF